MFSFLHLQNPLGHAFGDAYALPAPLVGPVDTTDYMDVSVFWCAPGDDGADLVPALDPTSFEHDAGVLLVGHANTNYYDAETSSTAAAEQQEHEQEEAAAAVGGGGDDADDDYGHHDLVFEYTSPDGKSFRLMRELRGYERALTRGMARLDRMHERNANAWKQWRAVFGPGSGHDPIWTGDGR